VTGLSCTTTVLAAIVVMIVVMMMVVVVVAMSNCNNYLRICGRCQGRHKK
jgi:hypothetical protein